MAENKRKTPVKKGTSKKASAKKSVSPEEEQKKIIEKELKGLLKKLDTEGLLYLLKQAQILHHNMQVDKINSHIEETRSKTAKKTVTQKTKTSVAIEEGANGKNFVIALNNTRKFVDLQEMRSIVRICHTDGDAGETINKLYRWFSTQRKDILMDSGVRNAADPVLKKLHQLVLKTYKVKK